MQTLIKKVLNRLKLLPYVNLTTAQTINGRRLKIPVVKGMWAGETEAWMVNVLKKLEPVFNKAFIDVGVNTGETLIKAWSVFGNLHYIGFEPNPACVYYVEKLVACNYMKNITLVPVGIACNNGLMKLQYYYDNDADSTASLVEGFRPGSVVHHYQYVPVFSYEKIKDLLPVSNRAILKIDVEGGEQEVIESLVPWITANHPVILVEILPVYHAENEDRLKRQRRIESLAAEMGYVITRINKQDNVSLLPVREIGIHGDVDNCDYLLYHNSSAGLIKTCFPE